jgi:hypothetical protein
MATTATVAPHNGNASHDDGHPSIGPGVFKFLKKITDFLFIY